MKKIVSLLKNLLFLCEPYYLYSLKYFIVSILFFALIVPLTRFLNVILPQVIIDILMKGGTLKQFTCFVIVYQLVLMVIPAFEDYFNSKMRDQNELIVESQISKKIFRKVNNLDYKYIDDPEYYKEYHWVAENYYEKAQKSFTILTTVLSSLSIIFSLSVLLSSMNVLITIVAIVGMILRIYGFTKYNSKMVHRDETLVEENREMKYYQRLYYLKQYALDLKSTRLKKIISQHYDACLGKMENTIDENSNSLVFWGVYSDVIYHVMIAAIIIIIVMDFYSSEDYNITLLITALLAVEKLGDNMYVLFDVLQQNHELGLYAEKIKNFFSLNSTIETAYNEMNQLKEPFDIEFKNVHFNYGSGFSLNNLNFHIYPGESVAIVGENGVGKSTLVKLLLRLYDVTSGEILINGNDIKNINLEYLRSKIGVAFQDTNIYAMSVLENLSLLKEKSKDAIEEELGELSLLEVLKKNTANIYSQMTREFSDSGIMLSKGEEQKIALARLMHGEYGVVILDEPSAALDPFAEAQMVDLLKTQMRNTTSIIISHRLSTVVDCDKIIVLDNSEIVECGTHSELMHKKGKYYSMFTTQAEKYQLD